MKILQVTAHPDDECLWAGGFLARLKARGHDLTFCCVSTEATGPHGSPQRCGEFVSACGIYHAYPLILAEDFATGLDRLGAVSGSFWHDFGMILTHSALGELNQHAEHRMLHRAVRTALREASYPGLLLTFGQGARSDLLVALSDAEMATKQAALLCHASQADSIAGFRHAAQRTEAFQVEEP